MPFLGCQRFEELEAGRANRPEHLERRLDRAVVVQPSGELLFVVIRDVGVVLGDEPSKPDVRGRFAVCQVMGDLTR